MELFTVIEKYPQRKYVSDANFGTERRAEAEPS